MTTRLIHETACMLTPDTWARLATHVISEYPKEACGAVLTYPEGLPLHIRAKNIIDSLHMESPTRFPRTGRVAHVMDPDSLKRIASAKNVGATLDVLYHSHPDTPATFSSHDQRAAVGADGKPLYLGTAYVIFSVWGYPGIDTREMVRIDGWRAFRVTGYHHVEVPALVVGFPKED